MPAPGAPPPPAASGDCAHQRAGNPQAIGRWAVPSDTGSYVGYSVGGGCLPRRKADPPAPEDGTWGRDYQGWLVPRRVSLAWWHGRRYQGSPRAYESEGPHLPHLGEKTRGH